MNKLIILLAIFLGTVGCTFESNRAIEATATKSAQTSHIYHGKKALIAIGKFDNKTNYQRGIFSDGEDRVGNQAQTVLMTHLQQTGRFSVLDRSNLSILKQEKSFEKQNTKIKGARFVITGDVTEFGRKVVGDREFFGILGKGKRQIAYSKVMLNVVDTTTSEVVYSASGAGEYKLSEREILGFGSKAGYDPTLTGKVLDLSIREAVDGLTQGIDYGYWQP